jgi:transposase
MQWQPKQLTREQQAERRLEGGRLLKRGKLSHAEIARRLGVSQAAVSQWKVTLQEEGRAGLKLKTASGRPSKLTPRQCVRLLALLKSGAQAAGFPTGRWTQKRIQKLIEKEFEVSFHPWYVGRLMKKLGWSVQQPESQAKERDDEAIARWLEHDWERIKKRLVESAQKSCFWMSLDTRLLSHW